MYKLRFAPSPTGFMHLANARVAILNYIRALQLKKTDNVSFILRIDDTDVARSKQIYTDQIMSDLKWLGIEYDEIYYQSQRTDIYNAIIEKLKEHGFLYPAYETEDELKQMRESMLQAGNTPRYEQTHEKTSDVVNTKQTCWRFKIEKTTISWNDEIMQTQSFIYQALYDPIVVRSDGTFTYILASIIDDYLMNITHIMRGRDHLTNTAIQIHMLNALNRIFNTDKRISFAHFPLLYSIDGQKLSKRSDSLNIKTLNATGILNITVMRFLLNLGLPKSLLYEDMKIITDTVDIYSYNRADILCDTDQLYTDNQKYVQNMTQMEVLAWINDLSLSLKIDANDIEKYWEIIKGEIGNKTDIEKWFDVIKSETIYEITEEEEGILRDFCENHAELLDNWGNILNILKTEYLPEMKITTLKEGITAFRHALTGSDHGPKMHILFEIIDKEIIKLRLKK